MGNEEKILEMLIDLTKAIDNTRTELKAEIQGVRTELETEIRENRKEIIKIENKIESEISDFI